MEELKRKAAQNSGEAEYIEKVVYAVKQSAEDVKKASTSLLLHGCVGQGATSLTVFLGIKEHGPNMVSHQKLPNDLSRHSSL